MLLWKSLLVTITLCVIDVRGKTLISYVYHSPNKLRNTLEWSKCATKGKMCGCDSAIKDISENIVEEGTLLTRCNSIVCLCKGNGGRSAKRQQCLRNLEFFLKNAIHIDPTTHDFLFNIVGETIVPDILVEAAAHHPNIEIRRVPMAVTDLCTQGNVARQSPKYKRYLFINCSARGPFFNPKATSSWIQPFEDKISEGHHLVGPVINCWKRVPHVQSWVWYADDIAAKAISDNCFCNGTRNDQITKCELNVSKVLLQNNNGIASLQPSYSGRDWLDPSMRNCNKGRSPVACSRKDLTDSLGCIGANICEEVFVKYGGTNIPLGVVSEITHNRVTGYDNGTLQC